MTTSLQDQLANVAWGKEIQESDPIDLYVGKRSGQYRSFVDCQEMCEAGYEEVSVNEIYTIAQDILNSAPDEQKKSIIKNNVKILYSKEIEKLQEEYEEINGLLPNIVKIASFILFPFCWMGAIIQKRQDAAKENLYEFMEKVWPEIALEKINNSFQPFEGTEPAEHFKTMLQEHILEKTNDQVTIEGPDKTSITLPGNIIRDSVRISDLRLNNESLPIITSFNTTFQKVADALGESVNNAPLTKLLLLDATQVGLADVDTLSTENHLGFQWDQTLQNIEIKDDRLTITKNALVYEREMGGTGLPKILGARIFTRQVTASISELKKAIEAGDLKELKSLKGEDRISESILQRKKGESLEELPTLIHIDKKTEKLTPQETEIILKAVEQANKNSP